jgi:hypothetical protein
MYTPNMGRRLYQSILLIIATTVLILPFQNCGSPKDGGASNNGEVYDGRPFEQGAMFKANNCVVLMAGTRQATFDIAFDRSEHQITEMTVHDGKDQYKRIAGAYFNGRKLIEPVAITPEFTLESFELDGARSAIFADLTFRGKLYSRRTYCNK